MSDKKRCEPGTILHGCDIGDAPFEDDAPEQLARLTLSDVMRKYLVLGVGKDGEPRVCALPLNLDDERTVAYAAAGSLTVEEAVEKEISYLEGAAKNYLVGAARLRELWQMEMQSKVEGEGGLDKQG